MFISDFSGDANFSFTSFTVLVFLTVNYIYRMDHFTISDGVRLNGFEAILWYVIGPVPIVNYLFIIYTLSFI